MSLPEIPILEDDGVKLSVTTDENPDFRVLLVDSPAAGGKVDMSEIGIAPNNVERLKKQSSRRVFQYKSKDGALWILGKDARWTLRIAVPPAPTLELALDEEQTALLKSALFEPLA
jgi:hypothetical protein